MGVYVYKIVPLADAEVENMSKRFPDPEADDWPEAESGSEINPVPRNSARSPGLLKLIRAT